MEMVVASLVSLALASAGHFCGDDADDDGVAMMPIRLFPIGWWGMLQ